MRKVLKRILRARVFTPLVALIVHIHLRRNRREGVAPVNAATPRLILLSDSRWRQDQDALFAQASLIGYSLSDRGVELLNALYAQPEARDAADGYFLESRPGVLAAREAQTAALARVVRWLRVFGRYDGFLTCSFRYLRETPLAKACSRIGAPFIAWHKEFTVLEERFAAQRIVEAKAIGLKFYGSHLFCVNDLACRLFSEAEIFSSRQVAKVGLLRADNMFAARAVAKDHEPNSVVLFSFGHLTGPFKAHPFRNYYFAAEDDFGFVELFKRTHALFAELAMTHPEIQFLIKPKNVEPGWFGEIEAAVRAELDVDISEIPNCQIVGDPAPDLIARSFASVCLNSTTVLESRLLGRNTILPLFAEAGEGAEHADMVYFRDYADVFAVADNEARYRELIERAIRGERFERGSEQRFEELLERQLGNADGRAGARLGARIKSVVDATRSGAAAEARQFRAA